VSISDQLHVVIPVYNGRQQTEVCLDALTKSSVYEMLKIVVVDHSPIDTADNDLRTQFPELVRLRGDPTLWWAGATNLGIRWVTEHGASRVMLLNNDCYVDPHTIERLLAHATNAGTAIIAPVQRDCATGKVVFDQAGTCFLLGFPTLTSPTWFSAWRSRNMQLCPTRLIVGGRGVLIPTRVFRDVGLFDQINLPHYGADHDFYLRCREKGIPLLTALDATVHIDSHKTTMARELGTFGLSEFVHTLRNRRSHRNLRDLNTLFKRHYPLKGLHYIGVGLNLMRYFVVYLWQRVLWLLTHRAA
jgi:GT2 family glycosyltransferase